MATKTPVAFEYPIEKSTLKCFQEDQEDRWKMGKKDYEQMAEATSNRFFFSPRGFCFFVLCFFFFELGFCVYLRSDLNESDEARPEGRTSFQFR